MPCHFLTPRLNVAAAKPLSSNGLMTSCISVDVTFLVQLDSYLDLILDEVNGTDLRPRVAKGEGGGGVGTCTCDGWKRMMSMSEDVGDPRRLGYVRIGER